MKKMNKLFQSPYKEIILNGLPALFREEQIRNTRAGRAGMEVGNARERVLIALCMFIFGKENIAIPPTTSAEEDLSIKGKPLSIKTKTGTGHSGIKIKWTTDWDKVDYILKNYRPFCDILLTKIQWGGTEGLYWIPLSTQGKTFQKLGANKYIKTPRRNTNPRGVEFSEEAIKMMIDSPDTMKLMIDWGIPDPKLESKIYDGYIDKWEQIRKNNKL